MYSMISFLVVHPDYLRFASCYKNVSLSEEKCAPWFKTMQQLDTQMQNDNVDAGLKKFCW